MLRLLAFLYRYRVFGFFLLLEGICIWLLIANDRYYNAYYFNSSNSIAASISASTGNLTNYLNLVKVNDALAKENALLRDAIAKQILNKNDFDTLTFYLETIPARVVNNDFKRSANFITVNKGSGSGILPGMGVISATGVIGIVKSSSKNYATITSLLNQQLMVSAQLKNTKTLCTVQWDGISPIYSNVFFIPRHIPVNLGDTVITSGFNAIFPEGLDIGIINEVSLPAESPFYIASIQLANDFSSLSYVYVINNPFEEEKDSLERINGKK